MTVESVPSPLQPQVDPRLIMAQLQRGPDPLDRQYVGVLADGDAKTLISRSYNTTKEEAAAVDRIVGSPLTLYISSGDFVRHAVFELLMAYEEANFPDEYIPDMTSHFRHMRESAQRLRLRQEFNDILLVYETSLRDGMEVGDFDLILSTLEVLEGYLERTPDPHWKHYLKRTVLRSTVMRAAIDAFSEWANSREADVVLKPGERKAREKYQRAAERWSLWLEGLAE